MRAEKKRRGYNNNKVRKECQVKNENEVEVGAFKVGISGVFIFLGSRAVYFYISYIN